MAVAGRRSKSARTNCIWKVFEQETLHRSVNQMMCFHAGWFFRCRLTAILNSFRQSNVPLWKSAKKKKKKPNCFLGSENQLDHNCEIITFEGDHQVLCNVTVKSLILFKNRVKPVEEISAETLSEKKRCCSVNQIWLWPPSSRNGFPASLHLFAAKKEKKNKTSVQINVYIFQILCESSIQIHIRRGLHTLKGTVCAHTQVHTIDL